MGRLTREEKETCIIWNEKDGTVEIWTLSEVEARRLTRRIGKPDKVTGESRYWSRPKDWFKYPRRPVVRALSDAKRADLSQRLAKARSKQNSQRGCGPVSKDRVL